MATELRIYVKYEVLYLAEYRALIRDIERAYNRLDSLLVESQRIRRHRRLEVQTISTGKSIEMILAGSVATLLLLGHLVFKLSQARKEYWASEEIKWKAKSARRDFRRKEQEEMAALTTVPDRNILEASEILEKRIIRVERSKNIRAVEVSVSDDQSENGDGRQ